MFNVIEKLEALQQNQNCHKPMSVEHSWWLANLWKRVKDIKNLVDQVDELACWEIESVHDLYKFYVLSEPLDHVPFIDQVIDEKARCLRGKKKGR